MLLRDLYLVTKHSPYLPRVLASSTSTDAEFRAEHSEMNYIKDERVTLKGLLREATFGAGWGKTTRPEVFTVGEDEHVDEEWFFVNGVTTSKDMAIRNAQCLSKLFQRAFRVVHNPTHGLIPDLAECAFARTFDMDCAVTKDLHAEVYTALVKGKKVKVIGHSQGGIIVSRLLRLLKAVEPIAAPDFFTNLEVYTFGSGADEDVRVAGAYQEHFANTDDFVARIGVIHVQPKSGTLYRRNEIGHLLNRDYLEHFAGGHFCGKKSKLYRMLRGGRA